MPKIGGAMHAESGKRFLIVKTSSMGDVVHALPLASDLARAHSDAPIDWLVEEGFADIARLHRAADRVIAVAVRRWRLAPLAAATWREIRHCRAQLRAAPYTAILDCQGLLKSAWLARWAHGPRWGFDRASAREPLAALLYTHAVAVARDAHAIARNRALGAAACGTDDTAPPRFDLALPPLADPALREATAAPYAVLLTNASRPTKLWPDERWRPVERWLHAQGLASLLVWGSAQEEAATQRRAEGMRAARVVPRCGLAAMATVLAQARIVIGLDTGLSHLAAAAGAPTLGIFCDYDPRLVGITGSGRCASLGGVGAAPTAEAVIEAAAGLLAADAARSARPA
jgi:heptosyltransferase-1